MQAAEAEKISNTISEKRESLPILEKLETVREQRHAEIRKLVLQEGRIDILAEEVLGYAPHWHHLEMMDFQDALDECLILAWRGAAKTTYLTITRCIFEILRDPNTSILIASAASGQAQDILRGIKRQFMQNLELRAIFGDYVTGAEQWSETAITIPQRTDYGIKEPTIFAVGTETALPSRHFKIVILDDVVKEENSQTAAQREKLQVWFYKTLLPCKARPDGKLWVLGTRYHQDDLYGYLQQEDYRNAEQYLKDYSGCGDSGHPRYNFLMGRWHEGQAQSEKARVYYHGISSDPTWGDQARQRLAELEGPSKTS